MWATSFHQINRWWWWCHAKQWSKALKRHRFASGPNLSKSWRWGLGSGLVGWAVGTFLRTDPFFHKCLPWNNSQPVLDKVHCKNAKMGHCYYQSYSSTLMTFWPKTQYFLLQVELLRDIKYNLISDILTPCTTPAALLVQWPLAFTVLAWHLILLHFLFICNWWIKEFPCVQLKHSRKYVFWNMSFCAVFVKMWKRTNITRPSSSSCLCFWFFLTTIYDVEHYVSRGHLLK